MHALLPLLFACTQAPPPTATTSAASGLPSGWGAVFWRGDQALQLGGGEVAVGPRDIGTVQAAGPVGSGPCGTTPVQGAPAHALLAPPSAASVTTPPKPPPNPAPVVEAATWRLDEVLPEADRFTPKGQADQPAHQRGVTIHSLVKVRRKGAPPVLLASGQRGCDGALVVLDRQASRVLEATMVPQACAPLHILPPVDLDGDGARETALFNDERVILYGLEESPTGVHLVPRGDVACPAEAE